MMDGALKVLVTGAAGFVGAEVVRALVERGATVIAPLRPSTARRRLEPWLSRIRVVETVLDDVPAVDALLAAERPDVVVHAAWYAHPRDYRRSIANLDSLAMTVRFAERVVHHRCARLVALGTCLEYRPSAAPLREDDPIEPSTLYASCKAAAQQVLQALTAGSTTEFIWARLFHIHGRGEDPERLLTRIARDLRQGHVIDLSPGLQVRDQLDVSDVAEAIAHLASTPGLAGAFNVASGVPVALRDVLTLLAELAGRRELLRFGARPYLPDEVMYLVGEPRRLRQSGWAPQRDLRSGLQELLRAVPD